MSPYKTLQQLYHRDSSPKRQAHIDAEARRRLESESTFRLGVEIDAGELFLAVPRELTLLNERVLRVERKISLLWNGLPGIARWAYVRGLILDEIISSNEMEGVHSSRKQVAAALKVAEVRERGHEVARFKEFAKLYLGLTDKNLVYPKEPGDIRTIYDAVVAGELHEKELPDGMLFRTDTVEVLSTAGRVLHTGVSPESKITSMITQMIGLVASEEIPATYTALVSHFLFEYIHPFYDGNGRTGRYLLALYLSKPLSQTTVLSLSRVIAEHKDKYYKAFDATEGMLNHAEVTYFVIQMMELIRTAQDELIINLEQKRNQLHHAAAQLPIFKEEPFALSSKAVSVLHILVQNRLFGTPLGVELHELSQELELGMQTARKYTLELENAHLITPTAKKPLKFTLTDKADTIFGFTR
ncbi:MAG: Fic family protein [Actinomycetes bacterium]|nr:Fic family protein [Actinomycetes bacterium]